MTEQLQAIATVLSLINPAICGAIFSKLESGRSSNAKIADAIKAGIAILVILALAAVFGTKVLKLFGISLDAFSCAGGFVLAWMGFGMIKGSQEDDSEDHDTVAKKRTGEPSSGGVSLTPLVLFAASPGTITGVITLAVAHSKMELPVTALVAIVVAVGVTVPVMTLLSIFGGNKKGGFVRETVSSLMGLIVVAMGFQFALTGIKAFMT
jgi:multiple antibiotic resistance protein